MTDLVLTGLTGEGNADLGDWRQVFWYGAAVTDHGPTQAYTGLTEPFTVRNIGWVAIGYIDDGTTDVPGGAVVSHYAYMRFDYEQFPIPAEIYTSIAWHTVFWRFAPGVTATVFVQWTAV